MTVHLQPSIFQMGLTIHSPEELTEYFEAHNYLTVPAKTEYLIGAADWEITWLPGNETKNLERMLLIFEMTVLEPIKKVCGILAQDKKLLLTTYNNGFGLMSLEGFVIECRASKSRINYP